MLKRLGKKVLPIIMATMLVAGMCAVSTSAVEVSNNSEIAVVKDTPSVYVDEETGVKLESSDIIVNEENVSVVDNDLSQLGIEIDLYEKSYSFYVYDENYDEINCNETAVTAYVPFENDSCYVIYYDIENKKATQLDAEYVDGSYKFNMIGVGEYYICDSPLAEGEGEIVQQTLVNEQTGVTVSGAIQTDTKLVVIDVFELLKNIGLDFDSLKSMLEENPDLATSIDKEQIELLKQMDGYIVCLTRNFEMVNPQGELTITLPNGNDSFAVRYADVMSEFSSGEFGDMELPEIDYTDETKTDEELAQEYNANIDKQMPILESEYVDGSYVVNSTNSGLFLIAPKDILYTTAEEIKELRGTYDDDIIPEEPTEVPTEVPTEAPTEAPTQTLTSAPTEAPTQAPTKSEGKDGKNGVATSDNVNAVALLMTLSASLATIFVFGKKKATK